MIHQGRDQGVSQPVLLGDRGLLFSIKVWRNCDQKLLLDVQKWDDGRWPVALNQLSWGFDTDAVAFYGLRGVPVKNTEGLLQPSMPQESPEEHSVDSQNAGESPVVVTPEKKRTFGEVDPEALTPSGKGGKAGQKDYTFCERLRLIDWANREGYIMKDTILIWVNARPGKERTVEIPWESQQPSIAVDTLLDWARAADRQCWREMLDDEALIKKYGEGWGQKKSRLPNVWRDTLKEKNQRFLEDDLPKLGKPSYLEKHPALLDALCKVDSIHKEERKLLEPATAEGFHETLKSELQMQQAQMPGQLPKSVSKSWTQKRLKDLKAQEVKKPCVEPATVTPQDEADYKKGLHEKLDKIGDLRLQLAWDEFSCVIDQAANRTLLHRTEPSAPWHEQRGHNYHTVTVSFDIMERRPHDHETGLGIVFYL